MPELGHTWRKPFKAEPIEARHVRLWTAGRVKHPDAPLIAHELYVAVLQSGAPVVEMGIWTAGNRLRITADGPDPLPLLEQSRARLADHLRPGRPHRARHRRVRCMGPVRDEAVRPEPSPAEGIPMTQQTLPPAQEALGGLEMLPLPKTSGLSDTQIRGAACVWCDTPLTTETARDLGERPKPGGGSMFPRGCATCAAEAARRVYAVHSRVCSTCTTDSTACGVRRSLRRIALEGRR